MKMNIIKLEQKSYEWNLQAIYIRCSLYIEENKKGILCDRGCACQRAPRILAQNAKHVENCFHHQKHDST